MSEMCRTRIASLASGVGCSVVRSQRLAPCRRFGDALPDTVEQRVLVHPELDHRVERHALLLEHPVECVRLRHRARKPVKNEPVSRIGLIDPVGDDRDHDIVGDELTAGHDILCTQPDRRAGIDRRAQQIAGGKLNEPVLGDQALGLSAFAGPRRAEQDQSHLRRPRSFERLIRPSY